LKLTKTVPAGNRKGTRISLKVITALESPEGGFYRDWGTWTAKKKMH